MKKEIIEEYRVSGNQVTHMKLTNISLSENETLSMLKRYRFDEQSARQMLEDSQKSIEEYKIEQEQKEYEEMNYSALYRRFSKYSNWELLKQLLELCRDIINLPKETD